MIGAGGMEGCGFISTDEEDVDMQPAELVTVKVYVPSGRFEMVILVPDPVVEALPGVRIRVQEPVAGRPDNTTLPVETVQVGCVTDPGTGAEGLAVWSLMVAPDEAADIQPDVPVTVNV